MTRAPRAVTIVGASLAGLNAAEALRREGFDGPVTLIGAENHLPYDRPPLSKQVLAGEWAPERVALTDPEELEEDGIEARLGVRATALDLDARELTLHSGETVAFDGLVIATGARCRTMPGTDQVGGVHVLRSLDDCLALRADLEAMPQRVVVVGAGFIGAEVAATARGRGLDVTMVEALPTPLSRVLGDEMGEVCAEVHRDHGVDLRTAVGVERISGDGRVERVTLSDGSTIDADVVVVGIGVIPNTEWLDGSGLEVDDGVMCDASCLAADRVAAAGDVARWPNALFGETMRVEHWDNAAQQGAHAARRLLDAAAGPFTPVPWFWSDQYDRKIQLAGRVRGDDEVRVVTGSVDERRFAAIYGRAGRIVGVLGFNRPRHVMRYRALIEQGASFDEALAAEF
ncbi:MAG: NAD(P)/FAD-dependent oxidoreductase [Acidimicrobiaceae bacterium]|nr:NAD(P)/FAD-dependent oxidoreductase [Acidimicrobiaceae bacterium]